MTSESAERSGSDPETFTLSIVIPARNEGDRIIEAVTAARELDPLEVIVVDGESEDETVANANHAGAVVITSPPGRGRQLRAGGEAATGSVLLFLHADNRLDPAARSQIETALENPDHLCGCFDHRIGAAGWKYRRLEAHDRRRVRRTGVAYGDQGIFFRGDVYRSLDGFSPIPLMEDVHLMRAFRQRYRRRPILLPGPLHISARRWEKNGVLKQSLLNFSLRVADRFGVSPERLASWYR